MFASAWRSCATYVLTRHSCSNSIRHPDSQNSPDFQLERNLALTAGMLRNLASVAVAAANSLFPFYSLPSVSILPWLLWRQIHQNAFQVFGSVQGSMPIP